MFAFPTFVKALYHMTDHNATHAFDCILLGLNTPLIDTHKLRPLVDRVGELEAHQIEILKSETRQQRRVIEATRKKLGENIIGYRNIGGYRAPVVEQRVVTYHDVLAMRNEMAK